jgi:hypothetical protein
MIFLPLIVFSDFYTGSKECKEVLHQKLIFLEAQIIFYKFFTTETEIKI